MFLLSVLFIIIGYDIEAPEPWSNSTFIQSGFGGYRTGWSNSLFLYVPILLYLLKSNYSFKNNTYIIFIILSILFLQFQSGGRAGLMFSILAIGLFYRKSFLPLSFITILLYLTFSLLGTEYLSEKFRLSGAQVENKQGSSDIDKISSGRLSGYTAAFSAISGSPIYGYGLGRSEEALELYGYGIEVHNTFLKRTLESGIFLLFYLVFFFSFLYFKLVKKLKYNLKRNWISIYEFRNSKNFLNVFFICAISISFLEPNYLIGSFQGELVFWFTLFSFEK
jgi:O-antigen ligase